MPRIADEHSTRTLAQQWNCSHAKVATMIKYSRRAKALGRGDEFLKRWKAREKITDIMRDIDPDFMEQEKARKALNSFYAATNALLKAGWSTDELQELLDGYIDGMELAAEMKAAIEKANGKRGG